MRVHKEGDHWIIATNFQMHDMNGLSGTLSHSINRVRQSYDCWDGARWSGQRGMAMKFASEKEAQEYMDSHMAELQATQ